MNTRKINVRTMTFSTFVVNLASASVVLEVFIGALKFTPTILQATVHFDL